ncbi:hypothetical protein FAGKG844_30223 [Frankia sp. AgKG'84/4]
MTSTFYTLDKQATVKDRDVSATMFPNAAIKAYQPPSGRVAPRRLSASIATVQIFSVRNAAGTVAPDDAARTTARAEVGDARQRADGVVRRAHDTRHDLSRRAAPVG